MHNNPFLKPPADYIRDHDIVGNATRIITKHLSVKYNKPFDTVLAWTKDKLKTKFKPKDPTIHVIRRDKNRDRYRAKTTLTTLLNWVDKNDMVLGPNLVVYQNYKVERSYVAEFVLGNLEKRSKTKKQMSEYFAAGEVELGRQANLLQSNYKLFNNSISGATSSPHNSLHFASSHTTLTSICRSCTSFANVTNENLLASNRPYFEESDIVASFNDIASRCPSSEIRDVIRKYKMNVPSPEDIVEIAMTSLRLYRVKGLAETESRLLDLSRGYTEEERAAIAFTSDLNSLKNFNDPVLRKFISGFLDKPEKKIDNPDSVLDSAFDDIRILTSLLNPEYTRGTSIRSIKEKDKEQYALFAAHVDSIGKHLDEWNDFIHAFLSTHTVPSNLHSVPQMNRLAVVGSDTDSSIFSVQELVKWHEDTVDFTPNGDKVSAVFAFIATQVVGNAMLTLSRQMGVRDDQFYRIGMKSEYFMPVLSLSNSQKHYVYLMGAKEESVYAKEKLDVKGVGYKNSRVPREVMDLTNRWYYELLMAVRNNYKLTPEEVMSLPAFVEHTVIESIEAGYSDLYLRAKVKDKESYAKPMSSIYSVLDFWNACFAKDHGMVTELPGSGIKAPVNLPSKAVTLAWIESIENIELAKRITEWCTANNRWKFTYLFVPDHVTSAGSLPDEIVRVVDRNRVLSDMTSHFYLFLTTFGIYMSNATGDDWIHKHMTKQEAIDNAYVSLT